MIRWCLRQRLVVPLWPFLMFGGGMAGSGGVRGWVTLLAAGCVFSSGTSLYAQGVVNFSNRVLGRVVAPVYGVEDCPCSSVPITGNSSIGYPVGCREYTGPLITGMDYTAALFAGPHGSGAGQLVFVTATGFRDGMGAGFFVSRTVNVPGIAAGQRATFQVRAWDNRGGAITTWEQVLADNTVPRGSSEPFSPEYPLGGMANGETYATLNLEGLTSFNLIAPTANPICPPLCQPMSITVAEGRTGQFCFEVCGPSCNYQWYFNGGAIPNATNSTLLLTNVHRSQAGQYFAIMDLTRVSSVATMSVLIDATVLWEPHWVSAQTFRFDLTGPIGTAYVIEASADLNSWQQVRTVTNTTGRVTFDTTSTGQNRRFFRARTR